MTTGVLCPTPILRFCDNAGNPLVGGQVLTQVGGVNTATYSDVGLTTPLPNPIILNSRGEIATSAGPSAQCFLTPNTVYTFTLSDANGNQIDVATYVNGVQVTQAVIGGLLWPQTAAELAAGVTPSNYAYPPYTLLRYGADPSGVADSTSALQQAINSAQKGGNSMVKAGAQGMLLLIGSSWSIDTNTTGIDFEGARVNASGFTSGNWLAPVQSQADPDLRVLLNAAHPIKNAVFVGPGAANTTAVCLYLNDTLTPSPFIAGLCFQNIAFVNWGQDVVYGNGAFAETFEQCSYAVSDGGGGYSATTYSISIPGGLANAGERSVFSKCAWYNKNLIISQDGETDTYFIGCSLDGAKTAVTLTGGNIFLIGCHIESGVTNVDNYYWFYVQGTNCALLLSACEIVVDANKTVYSPFWSDPACTNGGVFLDNCVWGPGSSNVTVPLISGGGNCRCRNLIMPHSGSQPTIAAFLNTLAYGTFASTDYTAEWTLSGGATRSNVQAPPGSTYSLSMPGVTGTPSIAAVFTAMRPGQYLVCDFEYLFPSTAGATFTANFSFNDKGGNTIGSGDSIVATTVAVGSWTAVHFKSTVPAPAGTIQGEIQFEVGSVASGTQTAYVGNVVINVPE